MYYVTLFIPYSITLWYKYTSLLNHSIFFGFPDVSSQPLPQERLIFASFLTQEVRFEGGESVENHGAACPPKKLGHIKETHGIYLI